MPKKVNISICSLSDPVSNCATIRLASPLSILKNRDLIEFDWGVTFQNGDKVYEYRVDNSFDIIIIQRKFPYNIVKEILEFARSNEISIIWELDDNLIEHLRIKDNKSKIPDLERIASEVDCITVSNEMLREYFSKYNHNIAILPNYLDQRIWEYEISPYKRTTGKLRILCAGTNTYSENFDIVWPALVRILEKYRGFVEICLWGRKERLPEGILKKNGITYLSNFIPDYKNSARFLQKEGFDLALVPLLKNSFNIYKSNIKYLEYSICRIPGIYSRVTPYIDSIKDSKTGIIVENDWKAWYNAIELMINNENHRATLSEKAYMDVRDNYLLEYNVHKWIELFGSSLNGRQRDLNLIPNRFLRLTNKTSLYRKLSSCFKRSR